MIPVTEDISPNRMVKSTIRTIAPQKLYHLAPFRRSFHHCERLVGSESSKACLIKQSLSPQYLYLFGFLPRIPRVCSRAFGSRGIWVLFDALSNHFLQEISKQGRFNARVCIAGTSTGGLIAIMLSRLRISVDERLDEYQTMAKKVFGKPRFFSMHLGLCIGLSVPDMALEC